MAKGTPGVRTLNTLATNARRASQAIGTRPDAEIALPASAQAKLDYLALGGRDFRASTPILEREMALAAEMALRKMIERQIAQQRARQAGAGGARQARAEQAPTPSPWQAAAVAYLNRLQLRLATGGADVQGQLARLDRQTIEQKGHSRIGYDSGDLLRQVGAAKIRLTR